MAATTGEPSVPTMVTDVGGSTKKATPAARPVRAGRNETPAKVVIESKQKRRTPKEIQDDNKKAAVEAQAVTETREANYRATVHRIAEIEDGVQREEIEYQRYAAHPDADPRFKNLATKGESCPKPRIQMDLPSHTIATSRPAQIVPEDFEEDQEADDGQFHNDEEYPPVSVVDSASSDGASFEVADGNDDEDDARDEDYVMDAAEEDEHSRFYAPVLEVTSMSKF